MFGNAQNVQFQTNSSESSSMMMTRHSMHTYSHSTRIISNENLVPRYVIEFLKKSFNNNLIFIFSTPTTFTSNDMKPALPPKLRSNSTKFFPSPPESPLTPNDPHNQSFSSSSLTLPSTPNNFYMDEMKTPTEVVKTPLLTSNESEMPCNNDIMNVNNDEVILRKKPAETVSDIIRMRIF